MPKARRTGRRNGGLTTHTQEIQARENEAWRLRVEDHLTQIQIAERLQITQAGVSIILKRVGERVDRETEGMVKAYRAAQVSDLEIVVRESWEAWQKSKEQRRTAARRTAPAKHGGQPIIGPDGRPQMEVVGESVSLEDQAGDVRFLQTVMQAWDQIDQILGIKVNKVALTDPSGQYAGGFSSAAALLNDDERNRRLLALIEEGRALAIGQVIEGEVTVSRDDENRAADTT